MKNRINVDFDTICLAIDHLISTGKPENKNTIFDTEHSQNVFLNYFMYSFKELIHNNPDVQNRFPHSNNPSETIKKYMDIVGGVDGLDDIFISGIIFESDFSIKFKLAETLLLGLKNIRKRIDECGMTFV